MPKPATLTPASGYRKGHPVANLDDKAALAAALAAVTGPANNVDHEAEARAYLARAAAHRSAAMKARASAQQHEEAALAADRRAAEHEARALKFAGVAVHHATLHATR
jgi:hypothetical protein